MTIRGGLRLCAWQLINVQSNEVNHSSPVEVSFGHYNGDAPAIIEKQLANFRYDVRPCLMQS